MKGSEILINSLKQNNIDKVYGILGREAAAIQFNELEGKVNFYLTHHENTAGMMACGIAQCTKLPQACFVTLGPGLTHIMTSVAMAQLDRLPVLFIAAQVERDGINYNNAHQCINGVASTASFVKYGYEVTAIEEIECVIKRACEKMLTPPFGPAFVSIPIDILSEEYDGMYSYTLKETSHSNEEESITENEIELVVSALQTARNPIIIIGDAAFKYHNDNENTILNFAEQLNIPILSTYASAGCIPYEHRLNWGILNSYEKHFLKINVWEKYFKEVDLILLLGYDPVEHHPRTWNYGKAKKVISVLPYKIDLEYKNTEELHNVVCDISELLNKVSKRVSEKRFYPNFDMINAIREKRKEFLNMSVEQNISIGNIHAVLKQYFKDNIIIASDVGLNRHLSAIAIATSRQNGFLTSAGLSSFGTGLALGMGAKIADSKNDVVVIAGDGGFLSSCCDLETVIRLQLKMLVIVYNSSAYSLIERYSKAKKGANENLRVTQFNRVSFTEMAHSMGCKAKKINNINEFSEAIKEYLVDTCTYVLEVDASYEDLYI